MKHQALFSKTFLSSKDKNKKIKCRLLQFLFCVFRVKGSLRYLFPIIPVTFMQNDRL